MFNVEVIKQQAIEEIKQENFRKAVDAYKVKLRKKKWYDKLFPWRIVFIKKENL